MKKTYIHVYYGNGKGKTSAAIGLCIRARGANKRILFAQFLKSGTSGETQPLIDQGIAFYATPKQTKFYYQMDEAEKATYKACQQQLFSQIVQALENEDYDIVVLDEYLDAVSLKLLSPNDLQKLLSGSNIVQDVVLTGRDPGKLLESADYATYMQNIKHPYDDGTLAREGIEY